SVPAILRGIRTAVESGVESNLNGQVESLGLEQAAEAARAGDPAVVAVLKRAAETLGWAVVEMDALFNPQKIILAGLIVSFGDALLKPLHEAVERFCSKRLGEKPVVSFSELGSFNGALGAAALAMHEWKPKR
ncbi:MAG TPA: ROK family protein, partial [Candidatus Dormibacteraeota bacterium]|nr:ROK family protein [Candidatus Dormibacteraeota bacterium]